MVDAIESSLLNRAPASASSALALVVMLWLAGVLSGCEQPRKLELRLEQSLGPLLEPVHKEIRESNEARQRDLEEASSRFLDEKSQQPIRDYRELFDRHVELFARMSGGDGFKKRLEHAARAIEVCAKAVRERSYLDVPQVAAASFGDMDALAGECFAKAEDAYKSTVGALWAENFSAAESSGDRMRAYLATKRYALALRDRLGDALTIMTRLGSKDVRGAAFEQMAALYPSLKDWIPPKAQQGGECGQPRIQHALLDAYWNEIEPDIEQRMGARLAVLKLPLPTEPLSPVGRKAAGADPQDAGTDAAPPTGTSRR